MRDKLGSAFAVSPDASSVRFGLGEGEEKPVVFDLAAASLIDSPALPSGLAPARSRRPSRHGLERRLRAEVRRGETRARRLRVAPAPSAIRPDASGFVLGADCAVRAYDAKGEERWRRPGPGGAFGVDFSADGEIFAVACRDGTIRWLRGATARNCSPFSSSRRAANGSPGRHSGYYMASAGGEDLIGWHVNRGWNQEADFFPASQFRAEYNRPDIVRLVLKTRDEGEAIRQANLTSDRSVEVKSIAAGAAADCHDRFASRRDPFLARSGRGRLFAAFSVRPACRPYRCPRRRRSRAGHRVREDDLSRGCRKGCRDAAEKRYDGVFRRSFRRSDQRAGHREARILWPKSRRTA